MRRFAPKAARTRGRGPHIVMIEIMYFADEILQDVVEKETNSGDHAEDPDARNCSRTATSPATIH